MLTMDDLNPLLRRRSTVVTGQGEKVGTLGAVYLDDADERPTWITVHTGLFGTRESFVPLDGAVVQGRDLVIRHERDLVTHAPSVDRDGQLSPDEEAALYRHYGIRAAAPTVASPAKVPTAPAPVDFPTAASPTAPPAAPPAASPAASPAAPPAASPAAPPAPPSPVEVSTPPSPVEVSTPSSPVVVPTLPSPTATPDVERSDVPDAPTGSDETARDEMRRDGGGTPWVVRSEERLLVGTERYEAGRARLRKYVVTEEASVTVPLVAETVRVDVEPITSPTPPGSGTPFQEETVELTAREEIAVVETETVAVERVRMRRVEVTGRSTVRAEVRKERVAVTIDGEETADVIGDDTRSAGRRPRKARTSMQGPAAAGTSTPDRSSIPTKGTNALLKGGKKRR